MTDLDLCRYVDVFYGCGETDRFFDDGIASKWFYIKALCGNTFPHAALPFGKMTVGAYSGGYPTGYGTHCHNTCGGVRKFIDTPSARGFSHLHHSGTGAIQYYYNYAVASPIYGDVSRSFLLRPLEKESARPGYYSAFLDDVRCEMTVDGGVAIHKYTFGSDDGRIAIDFSNDGLDKSLGTARYGVVANPQIEILKNDEVTFSGVFSGVKLYFCVRLFAPKASARVFDGSNELTSSVLSPSESVYGAVFDFEGREAMIKVAYSTVSASAARDAIRASALSFEEARDSAYNAWNERLSAIRIECEDDDLKEKFYSNLYHSLVKPTDMTGESILGVDGDVVIDLATLWDQYKTLFPLIYTCYPDMSEKLVKGLINISRTLGHLPCSFGMTDKFPCEEQAKMLGILALCDAYYMQVKTADAEVISECTRRELARDDFKSFLTSGLFERYTHIIDATEACFAVAEITDDPELKSLLIKLAENWKNAYGNDGLISEKSPYYEGDRYTYSFRIQKNMEDRVALAGGKERFKSLLDDFFGFSGDSIKPMNYVGAENDIAATSYHRFEGFNNECDMETPYAYIFADDHDSLCEIVHECVTRSFGMGRSGLPGNNDSGGLSSMLVWNTLGIFPISGRGEFLIGAPQVSRASINLASGNLLNILVDEKASSGIYVDRVELNGKEILGYAISASDILAGGELRFYMRESRIA